MDLPEAGCTLYQSPAVTIGKHEWRVLVILSSFDPAARCTAYQWRRVGEMEWHAARDWPSYDTNDGMYGGLPRSLGSRLYEVHVLDIRAALTPGSARPSIAQLDLFS